jgi:DNA-binding MarR family transcriptional regulator
VAAPTVSPSPLQLELRQRRPFPSPEQEAGVGVLRTAELLRGALARAIEPFGITHQQYNVLRILRGSSPEPLPVLEIAARMIERTPGITRLLDRLEAKELVRRERCVRDRRQVLCWITAPGLESLAALDGPVEAAVADAFASLSPADARRLSGLLDRLRAGLRAGPRGPTD